MATAETPRPPKYVGARVLRVEDTRFLMGRATYVDDVELPGMLHAAFLRSPYPHARIKSINVERARALDGVVAVVTGEDLRDFPPYVTALPRPEVRPAQRRVLPIEKVRHVGEALAVAVARSRYIAEDACELIEVEWEELPAVANAERALAPGAPLIDEEFEGNNFAHIEYEQGDVEKAFAEAAHVFSKRFHHGRCMAAPLETRGVVADYDRVSGELTMWTSTQMPHLIRTFLAGPLGVPETKMRVIAPAVGGGFGMKVHVFVEEAIVPLLSKMVGRPVKWIEDRYENLAASAHAKEVICYIDIAVKEDGTFLAFRGRYVGDGGAYTCHPWTSLIDPLCAAAFLPSLYHLEACRYEVDNAFTNKCVNGAYRGVGWTSGHTARESLIDDIARALDMDPLELRLKNTFADGEAHVTATGCKYDGGSYAGAQRNAAELVDYPAFRERQRRLREQGRYLGIGFSPFIEPGGWSGEMARANGFPADYLDSASVTIEPDGSVAVTAGLHSHGQAHETTLAQLAADELGVRMEDVRIIEGDTALAVYGTGTYGSRSAVIGGGAIMRAAKEVRDKLVRIAAHVMEVSPDDIEVFDGRVNVKGVPEKSMTVAEVAGAAYFGPRRPADMDPALTSTRSYDPPETYANGCIVAIVEVDVETGYVDLQRIAAVEDCGIMLNPMVVEGQMAGAIAQGIGGALYEELAYDENGQFLAGSLMDYLYPSTMEVPPMDLGHIETPSLVTEGGIKGVGEGGNIGGPAAVVNAVADALSPFGVTIESTPLTPNKVLSLIRAARQSQGTE